MMYVATSIILISKIIIALYYYLDQFSGHDHTIFINENQRNYDVIMSKYVT